MPPSAPKVPAGVGRLLGRFTALEEVLRARVEIDPVVPHLMDAPIRKLVIDSQDIEISDSQLHGLVTGMHNLRHLKLDHISTTAVDIYLGATIRESLQVYDGDARTAAERTRVKYQPRWTSEATVEGYAPILRSAAASGMLVEGTVAACLDWQQDFDRQFEQTLVDYAFGRKDPQALITYYGPQRAGEIIRRRRSGFINLFVDEEEARPLRRSSRRGKEAQR